jgi:hypothetical protein
MTYTIPSPLTVVDGPSKNDYDKDDAARIELFGPIPVNPFTLLREDRGLNINQLAIPTGVNNKALTRLERGMYVNPLPRVVDYWVHLGLVTEGELCADYENYRYLQRRRHVFFFGPNLLFTLANPTHPFRQLRQLRPDLQLKKPLPVGLFECCAALCLPLDSIQHFEKKWRTAQSVPKELKLTLNQVGYTREMVSAFERCYKMWRDEHSSEVKVS